MTDATYDAHVYDLDNTLVRLAVDWDAVRTDVSTLLDTRGIDPPDGLWGMVEVARETGHAAAVEEVVATHERAGAHDSTRLPAADTLQQYDRVGVCSLNCEAACHIALEKHGLTAHVDSVVGRDTVGAMKPDPEPLLTVLDGLTVHPDGAIFVGDAESDAETARRAGTAFSYVSDWVDRAYP